MQSKPVLHVNCMFTCPVFFLHIVSGVVTNILFPSHYISETNTVLFKSITIELCLLHRVFFIQNMHTIKCDALLAQLASL